MTEIADRATYDGAVRRFREQRIRLPTFAELAAPAAVPARIQASLQGVDPDSPDPRNLFRVHWYNDAARTGRAPFPVHVVLPEALTGVPSPIVVALGDTFPMIHAHKVLAAYGCLAPRIVTGRFDPSRQRALWPSTGNYCRGGVAISRIMGCRGVAILPQGMSAERFAWLERWVTEPGDIIRTPGTESNVKEIYDACAELAKDPANVILNQFAEFGNHLVHYAVTGRALEHCFTVLAERDPSLRLAAMVSASGSAGTLGAGDWLKDRHGAKIVAVEALECPTMLYNGFGEHNIQGIGDKHIPFIHNVTNTDVAVAVTDHATDQLLVVFNDPAGHAALAARGVRTEVLAALPHFGLSSICNVVAAIKTAKRLKLGREDVILTVATDGAAMYASEIPKATRKHFGGTFDRKTAEAVIAQHLSGADTEHVMVMGKVERDRVFNLGYFTWVEQQGVPIEDFVVRRDQGFWRGLRELLPAWDAMITDFNGRTGLG
ncbi:MAG TPA: pyridoxal-phosphate dependent enzyme [Gemmatimonadales bacterium]|nr:pyridoxal-phosphate dependent enzyme [Gemmatimonadales bacterium]